MAPIQRNRSELSARESYSVPPPPQDPSLNSEASSTYLLAKLHLPQHHLATSVRGIGYIGYTSLGTGLRLSESSFFSSQLVANRSTTMVGRAVVRK